MWKFVKIKKIFAVQWELRHYVYPQYIVLLRFLMSVKRVIWPLVRDLFTWVER